MNRTLFKLTPVALALAALSSCSNEDFLGQGKVNSANQKSMIVNIDNPSTDEPVTRSSFYGNNSRVFNSGDKLRAYDEHLQKFDVYSYQSDNTFTSEDENVSGDPSYMLFPADNVEYGSWKSSTGMYALTKLAVATNGTLNYKEEDVTISGATQTAYISNIPEFGKVTSLEDGVLKADAVYLTGMLKIKIENGASNVLAIRVSSLTSDDNANTNLPLWGYFDAVLDAENALTSAANKSKLVKSTEALAPTVADANATLIVDLSAEQLKNYTSYVYIPIIPTTSKADNATDVTYPKLKVEYFDATADTKNAKYPSTESDNNGAWVELTTFTNKQIKTNTVYSKDADGNAMEIKGFDLKVEATTLKDINDALTKYAALGTDMTITVNLGSDLAIPAPTNTAYVAEARKLIVPQLSSKITLDITDGGFTTNPLVIEDAEGVTANESGQLTINLATAAKTSTAVNSTSKQALELKSTAESNTFAGVTINNAECDFTMSGYLASGQTLNLTAAKSLTLAVDPKAPVSAGTVDVNIGVDLASGSNVTTTTGKVTVAEEKTMAGTITTEGGEVIVNGTASGNITTASGKITIAGTQQTGTVTTTSGEVEVSGEAATVTAGTGKVTITGKIATLSAGGDIEIELEEEGEAITTSLNFTGKDNQTVTLNQGYIKEIIADGYNSLTDAEKEAKTITVDTSKGGLTAIATVADALKTKIDFGESKWDGNSITSDTYSDYVVGDIYTASMLDLATKKVGTKVKKLYANIDLNNKKWTAVRSSNASFDGNNKTIKNLKLYYISDGTGLFSKLIGKNTPTIKDLTIDGVVIGNDGEITNGIGALAGHITNGTWTISNVEVKNINFVTKGKKTYVGGLIGKIDSDNDAKVTLKGVKTSGVVAGYSYLGGFIGFAQKPVTIDAESSSDVTFDTDYNSGEDYDLGYLRIGQFIGSIANNVDVKITTDEANVNKTLTINNSGNFTGKKQKGYTVGEAVKYYDIVFPQTLIGYSGFEASTAAYINAEESATEANYTASETKPTEEGETYLYYVDK